MLKEVPNNNDSVCIANKMPNSNDAPCIANNMHLTTIGAKQFLMAAVYIVIMQKSQLTRDMR